MNHDRPPGSTRGGTLAGGELTLALQHSSGDSLDQAEPDVAQAASESTLRFRLLRPHAHGGLGEVYVAHDTELNREVALKRIRDSHVDTPENRARFLLEAEVTGGLEHPGIVPVYSLGTSDDGRPFYAMRFIRGESLREAILRFHQANDAGRGERDRLLELRKLLARFIHVCNAIEYAHSRGVLHRDLKPENIMLGAYGETLVVDWGLAKPLGEVDEPVVLGPAPVAKAASQPQRESGEAPSRTGWISPTAPTQMGAAVGTPAYMSPEQAAGDLERIGVTSDVYSLGATLYCLLCGRPPFDDVLPTRLLEQVKRGELIPPRGVRGDVPAALEAICLKAMAFEPGNRYPSPSALAAELECWLADEPVGAHRAAWHERLARWARRHRRGVEAAVAALAVVAVVSIVAAVLVHAAKQQAEHERDATRAALEAETEAKRQAHVALEAEREARMEAMQALDNYVRLVTEEEGLEGDQSRPLRTKLLNDALSYYEKLIDDNDDDVQARHELAGAILRVGRIHHATGSREQAIDAYRQAATAFETLSAAHPREQQYQRDLSLCYRSLANLHVQAGEFAAAADQFRRAAAILEVLVGANPEPDDQSELAETWFELAAVYGKLGQSADEQSAYRHAVEQMERAIELAPDKKDYRPRLEQYRRALP